MKESQLIRHTNIMFISTVIAGLSNFIFQICMNRTLSRSDFAIFYALLSLFMIVSVPATTIQTVLAKSVSLFKTGEKYEEIKAIFKFLTKMLAIIGFIGLVLFILASGFIGNFLKLPDRIPIMITGVALYFSFFIPVGYGTLQGLQKFNLWGADIIISSIARLGIGVFLVIVGLGVNGAMASSIVAAVVAFSIALAGLQADFRKKGRDDHRNFAEVYKYSFPVLITLLLLYLLSYGDILMVKHFFSDIEAAVYSSASVLGRAIVYLPAAVAMVMFPKVSEAQAKRNDPLPFLKHSLLYAFILMIVAAGIFSLFSQYFVRILLGKYDRQIISLLRYFGFALIPFGINMIIVQFNLALKHLGFLFFLLGGTILHFVILSFFHATLHQVIFIIGTNGIIILLVVTIATLCSHQNKSKSAEE